MSRISCMSGTSRAGSLALLVLVLAIVSGCTGASTIGSSSAGASTTGSSDFTLTSSAVADGELLPQYRGQPKDVNGVEKSIPLAWSGVPSSAKSLAVIMHHYPFPGDTTRVNSYLLLWGIPPTTTSIPFGKAGEGPWFMGANKDGTVVSYTSPNSPSPGPHEYTITLYALSETPPSLPATSTKDVTYEVLVKAIKNVTVIDTATLTFVSRGGASRP